MRRAINIFLDFQDFQLSSSCILERRDFPTHRDSAGRVHLRPLPPKWADGHWLQWEGHPTSHSYWMRLPKVSLLAWQVYLEGLTLASAVYIIKKKAGTGMPGETPSLSPCATRVLFSTCAFQHYHTAFRLESGLWLLFSIVFFITLRPEDLEVLEDGQCLKASWTRQILRRPHLTIIEYYIKLDPTWIHVM